ncbi:mitogen-activated protein kinase kinase kinase 3-like isoform X2 [Oryza brachyantha]|uniref:mitogen-activated protein kinase kinase kinase 3-like isoform X2 n=1 Tax=Oryza brachyantha TaxID=4533 RepID=UPI001ADCE36F|nr:mitogen-activated protein kinase kinase kinase 3-like isoform X2 [Oryza brachyantha]
MPLGWLRRKWRRRGGRGPAAAAEGGVSTSPRDSVDLGNSAYASACASPTSAAATARWGRTAAAAGQRCCGGGPGPHHHKPGLPLPRPVSKSAPMPLASSLAEVDAAAVAAATAAAADPAFGGCVSAADSVSSRSSSDEATDHPNYRYTDPVVHTSGRTVLPNDHNSMVEESRFVSSGALLEHQKFFEVPIANVKEVHHMQNFEPSTSDSNYSRGRMLAEDTFGSRTRSHSPGPRGYAFAGSGARDFGFSPRSPVKRMDDPNSPSQPLPLPPVPVASSSLPSSSITSNQFQSQWKRGKLLGSGTFGQVYLGFNSENGQFCAIKEVQVIMDDSNSKERLRQLNQEIDILKQLSHQNIVQYYGSEMADEALSIYLEYVSGGSIHKLLREYGPFKEPVIRNYTRQILSGLAYLHGRNTLHRDIKGANILVGPNGEVKLADFGMAKHATSFAEICSFTGSPYWMAPEVVMNNKGYNLVVDIWSLGCTIIEMATAKHPWYPYEYMAAIFKIANTKLIPEIPECFSKEGKDFLSLCLKRDPAQRPSATWLLGHPFVDPQSVRAPTCNGTQLRNGISSPAGIGNRKPNRESSSKRNIAPLHGIAGLSAREFAGFSTAHPSPHNISSPTAVRTNMSLPVSPCSSPLRQFKQSNWSCLPSPSHPALSPGLAAAYPNNHPQNQSRRIAAVPDPLLESSQLRPPSPYGSPKRF